MKQIYIECAGLRIPYDWTPDQLERALERRRIKLDNKADIISVFSDYLNIIITLSYDIHNKRKELSDLNNTIFSLKSKEHTKLTSITPDINPFKVAPLVPMPRYRKHRKSTTKGGD